MPTALLLMVGVMVLPASAAAAPPSCDNGGPPREVQPGEAKQVFQCFGQPGVAIHVTITQQGAHGTASVVDNDTDLVKVLYTAAAGPAGTADSFNFQASNGDGPYVGTLNTTRVANTDDAPACTGQNALIFDPGVARTVGSCSDPDAGSVLDVEITQQGTHGTAVVVDDNTDHPHVEYTANSSTTYSTDTIKFKATDGTARASNVVSITTQNNPTPPADRAPSCQLSPFSGIDDLGQTKFLGSCADLDPGDLAHVEIVQQGTRGVASITENDTFMARVHYTPSAYGTDQFKVRASYDGLSSPVYTVNTLEQPGPNTYQPDLNQGPLEGGSSAGTVRVSRTGTLTLRQKIDCTGSGGDCKVVTALSAKVTASSARKKTLKLGGSKFTVKAGKKGAIKLKLTKKGLKLLKRKRKIKGTIKVTIKRGNQVQTKKRSVTLKAPKKK